MSITILDYLISSIPYISHVPSMFPISDQFPMDNHHNIYVISIDSEEHSLPSTDLQLIQDQKKPTRPYYITITLFKRHASEENHVFFDQVNPLLEPEIHHH